MKKLLVWLLAFFVLLSFSGCKKTEDNSVSSVPAGVNSEITQSELIADDSLDPENTEETEDGASVNIENITHKKGEALGIDVSKWQGKIDWKAVKNSGIEFAIIRLGYRAENGKIYKDANADYNIQQAQKAGILVGVYFFSTAVSISEANEEANFVLPAVRGYKISYPIVYDCEGYLNADSRMYGLTATQRTDNAVAFLNTVNSAGYTGMFYGAKSEIENNTYWDMPKIENSFKVWIAHYSNPTYPETQNPSYNGKYDMWQYTNRGTVSGIEGNCDINVSYFTAKEATPIDSSATPNTATAPKTEEELKYQDVNDTVTAKEEVNLREGPGTKYNAVGKLKSGEFLTRTGIGTNGWSRLIYNGQTVYAITSYLTNEVIEIPKVDMVSGCTFTPQNDRVTAKEEVNLRTLPTTGSEIVGKLVSGTFIERTAIGDKGWSRLNYNGQTVYAVTSYLTTTAPEIDNTPPITENNGTVTEHGMTFKSVTPQNVTAKEETNLRDKPTTDSNIVYTLKNGEYVTKTAESDSGWARLEYNGQTVYAVNSFLR